MNKLRFQQTAFPALAFYILLYIFLYNTNILQIHLQKMQRKCKPLLLIVLPDGNSVADRLCSLCAEPLGGQ
jgi:hypothetical protein